MPVPDRPLTAWQPADFAGDPVTLAPRILGSVLVHTLPDGERLSGRVVEVEAYDCPRDPACTAGRFHAARTAAMRVPPGRWLFWTAHGHPLLQVACRLDSVAASILIRALEPLEGVDCMLEFRPVTRQRDLTNGPAKLVRALGIDPQRVTGLPVTGPELQLLRPATAAENIQVTARVGLQGGRNLPWRFHLVSPWVSPAAPSMDLQPS